MQSQSQPLAELDASFGPHLKGRFDFTLRFEHLILTILPMIILILLTPIYLHRLSLRTLTRSGYLLYVKLSIIGALVAIQIANVVLWGTNVYYRTAISMSAAALSCFGALCIIGIIFAEHFYSLRPSTVLSIFLSLMTLFDIAKTRSYFMRDGLETIAGLHIVIVVLEFALLMSQELSKRKLVHKEKYPADSYGHEVFSGFWNRSLFVWLNSTLLLGFRRIISVEDLHDMGPQLDPVRLHERLQEHWQKTNRSHKHALAKALLLTFPKEFFVTIPPRLCYTGFTFAQPFLLKRLIEAVGLGEHLNEHVIGGLIGATAIIYFGNAVSRSYYQHTCFRMATISRGALTMGIYQKVMRLSLDELGNSAAVTHMSTDMIGVEHTVTKIHDAWASIIELALGIYILATVIGPACILIVIPTVVTSVASPLVAKKMGVARSDWNLKVQARVAATSNILAQMKSIRMSGLAPAAAAYLQKLRNEEIAVSMKERHMRVVLHGFLAFTTDITLIVVIAGALFWTQSSSGLTIAEIFTTLAVVAIVSHPLAAVIGSVPFVVAGLACISRIQGFLSLPEIVDERQATNYLKSATTAESERSDLDRVRSFIESSGSESPHMYAAALANVTIANKDNSKLVIRNVNLELPVGSVTMVIGPVGCGKSLLLKSIIGEVKPSQGSVAVAAKYIGFCDQTPWVQNVSIRDNIVGQRPYSETWYKTVVSACALEQDLKELADGDNTLAGSGGGSLSGGQKHRVALARAIYSDSPLLVLDDVLSALDVPTSRTILQQLMGKNGLLRGSGTTVVMTTNMGEHLSYSDHVFAFDAEGKLHERHESKEIVQDLENLQKKDGNQEDQPLAEKDDEKAATSQRDKAASETNISDRQKGDFSLYGYYLKSTGLVAIALWIWTVWLAAVASRMPVIYIRLWMDEDPSNKLYYIGFALLGVGSLCATLVTVAVYYLRIVPKSSTTLHWRLLNTVLTSTLYWLSDTDTGSILNRFSQDVTLISQKLPISFLEACYLGTCVLVDIGIISSGSKYAAPIIPLFVLVLWAIQYFYLRTSRQLRLLDLELVSPLYSHFTESSNGIEHIRAFRWQEAFVQQLIVHLDRSQKPYYYLFAIQRWLILVLGLVTFMIAIVLVSFALNFIESTSETALGLALLNLITFSSNVADFVDSWVVLETSLGAVARVRDFTRNTPMEEDVDTYEPDLLENWPETGTIEFESVNASYKPLEDSSKRVLDDVSVTIPGGSKVAVTGRTGSGKSSLLLMLLHFLQYEGSVTIDGKDIRRVPRETLRDRLTTLTQDGVKLDGSVRANLDPRETATSEGSHDDAMITVLRRVNLWSIIEAGGGLDANLIGLSLSHGQMQLLSLARAVFHQQRTKSKIVLVDEATSNVDLDTDKCMQEVMTESFAGCTVIIIAHRVHVVEGADRVLRMEGGRIVAEETREENAA